MKRKELNEARNKDLGKLTKEVEDLRLKIDKILTERSVKGDKNVKKVSNLRRDLAQTLTLIREKVLLGQNRKGEEEKK